MVMVNVERIVTKVSNALCTLVPSEQPGFRALFKRDIVLLCAEVVRQSSTPWDRAQQMLGGQPWRAGVVAPPSVAVLLTSVAVYRQNLSNSVKKCKIRAITAFKVIQGH